MARNETRAGSPHEEPARHDQSQAKSADLHSPATVTRGIAPVVELAAFREFRSWLAAAEHLNRLGYPAAVPAALVARLSARGLAVWPAGGRGAA